MAEQVSLDISIDALKKDLAELQKELLKTGQTGQQSFASVTKEAQALSKEMNELVTAEKQAASSAAQVEKATGGFGARIKGAVRDTQVFGKSIGEWQGQLGGATSGLLNSAKASGVFQTALRGIGLAIKATGIGLLIGLVLSAIQYFTKFQSGMDKVARVTAGVGAVIDVLVSRFLNLGKAIINFNTAAFKLITGDFTGAMQDFDTATESARASVAGLADELVNAANAAAQLEKDRQALREFVQDIQKRTAQREVDADVAARIADDETKAVRVRIAALGQEGDLKRKIAEDELAAAKERQRIALRDLNLNAASRDNADKRNEAEAAAIEVIKASGKVQEAVFEAEKKQRDLRKQASDERQKQIKKERDDLEKLRKDLENLRVQGQEEGIDKDLAAVNKKYDDLIRVATNGVEKLNEIERRRGLTPEEQAQRQEFAALAVQLEERRLSALVDVVAEYAEKDLEIERELQEQKEALAKGDYDRAVASLEREKKLREQQINIGEQQGKAFILRLKEQGASEQEIADAQREFDLLTQQARLRAEIDFQTKLLEITAAASPERAEEIKKQIELLQAQLANVDFEIENPERRKFNLLDFLGIDPENQDDFKKAIEGSIDLLRQLGEARLAEAEAAVEAAEKKVDAAKSAVSKAEEALERELELAELGFASDVSLRQQELAAAQAAQVEAEKLRQQALISQQKAAKAQLIQDSVVQASNIITASSSIFKEGAKFWPVGFALAIASVASLVALFAGIRARVRAITSLKAREGMQGRVGDDGVIVGPSHENKGVPLETEGGEFFTTDGKRFAVVNKKMTATHYDLLRAINRDDRPGMTAYMRKLTGGVTRDTEATGAVVESVRNTVIVGQKTDEEMKQLARQNNRLLDENNRLTKKLLTIEEEREQVFDMGEYYLIKKAGRETRLRKRP